MSEVKHSGIYNRIWLPAALLLTVLLSVTSFRSMRVQALALEQQARCGIVEHTHTQSCYRENTLICAVPAHTHTRNCYLVLLKDNDINTLLTQVEQQEDHSLEGLIGQTVDNALHYNTDLTSPMVTVQAEPLDVAAINETIVEQDIQPMLVFNEDLYSAAPGFDGELPQQTSDTAGTYSLLSDGDEEALTLPAAPQTMMQSLGPTVSPMSLDDPVSTGSGKANYYVYLDGTWRTVGTLDFSYARSGTRYYARETTTEVLGLYNRSLGVALLENDLDLIYATSANASSYSWTDATVSGSYTYFGSNYSRQSDARRAKYVRLVDENGDPMAFYSVTLEYPDGTETVQYVRAGDTIKLPELYAWQLNGMEYAGGSEVQIYAASTFTARESNGKFYMVYNVNFPSSVSGVSIPTRPTMQGMAETTATDIFDEGNGTRIRNVSQQEVIGRVTSNNYGLNRVIRFAGWQIEGTNTILSPNSAVSWEELKAYAGSGNWLSLVGVWEYRAVQTASFYIRYDSVAVDTEGNVTNQDSNLYTPELHAAFVGGDDAATLSVNALNDLYLIADTTSDNSYGADQAIRALYGNNADIWLTSFPRDEDVFEQLKNYATNLEVEGETVNVNDLNPNGYAIRWYVFKCQDDAWHIDGKLVKKQGFLDVTKHFAGNREAIEAAKEGFYMEAYDDDGDHDWYLYINEPDEAPRDGNVMLPTSVNGDTYTWHMGEVEYDELWTIEEIPDQTIWENVVCHSSYRVIDGYNDQNQSGDGTEVQVYGVTYATDMGEVQALRVGFTNIYHTTDSIIIKKEDASTGSPLSGAVFGLEQNGQTLYFTYDPDADRYIYDPYGPVSELIGNGYYELVIEGFSYDDGPVEVLELQAPTGYTPLENIVLGKDDNGEIGILNDTDMAQYENGLLTVKNSTDSTFVSVSKQWLCPEEEWQEVTVQLLANGQPVTALISGVEPIAILSDANGYTYVWQDLPEYANGQMIQWSVREIQIGNEPCLADYSFVNWLVDYNIQPVFDEYGDEIGTAATVTNDTRRTLLRLVKTNMGGGIRLEGATFMLEHLLDNGSVDSSFIVRTGTTAEDGTITFDNLKYGRYRLTEAEAPDGYVDLGGPIYLTIEQDGTVIVEPHIFAEAGSTAFSILVKNQPENPLPETGGIGNGSYIALGIALMLMSLGGILFRHRKKGGYPSG